MMALSDLQVEKGADGTLRVTLTGEWQLTSPLPSKQVVVRELEGAQVTRLVTFDTSEMGRWDSSLVVFLLPVMEFCSRNGVPVDRAGLPPGVDRLLCLATEVQETEKGRWGAKESFLARLGGSAVTYGRSTMEMLAFIGETVSSLLRVFRGKAACRGSDCLLFIQECTVGALPIVSLITLLVGLILAFVGAIQLRLFGAEIFVADLVGIGMVRAMGAIMTGIIMAGRTGASFAATLGTMQVNEEIDALRTTGISPFEFLVLPRMAALSLAMPLLTLYADFMGLLGGLVVGVFGLGLSPREYVNETAKAVTLTNVWIGLFSSLVYGVIIAVAGCMRGMQSGRSASSVGDATTSAVVTGIVGIVVATAVITVLCNILGI